MKIYLASSAPGTEGTEKNKMCSVHNRLLSYWHIITKDLFCHIVFREIKRINRIALQREKVRK